MAHITQGRDIPEGDKERLACEIKKFDAKAAPDIIKAISEAITHRKSGWIRPHLKITDGRITGFQLQTDFTKDLDGESRN